jgi:hypothetical protein
MNQIFNVKIQVLKSYLIKNKIYKLFLATCETDSNVLAMWPRLYNYTKPRILYTAVTGGNKYALKICYDDGTSEVILF